MLPSSNPPPRRRAAVLEQTATALIPLRPLTIGETLDASFLLLQRSPRRLLGLPLVVAVAFALTGGALLGLWTWLGEMRTEQAQVLMTLATVAVLGLVLGCVVAWLMGVLSEEALRMLMGERLASPTRATLRTRLTLVLPMITAVVLTTIFLALTAVVTQTVQTFLVWGALSVPDEVARWVALVLATVLSVFVGCWTFSFISLAIPIYVAEGPLSNDWIGLPRQRTDLAQAFVRSLRLVGLRDSLRVALALLAAVAVVSVIALLVWLGVLLLIALYVLGMGLGLDDLVMGFGAIGAAYAVAWVSVAIVAVAWLACLLTVVYLDLRMRREGLDLALRFPVVDVPEPNDGRS